MFRVITSDRVPEGEIWIAGGVEPEQCAKIHNLAVGMYSDEPCRVCGEPITAEDVGGAVFAGYSTDNRARAAHKRCWTDARLLARQGDLWVASLDVPPFGDEGITFTDDKTEAQRYPASDEWRRRIEWLGLTPELEPGANSETQTA